MFPKAIEGLRLIDHEGSWRFMKIHSDYWGFVKIGEGS
jgi:hypothetical protein